MRIFIDRSTEFHNFHGEQKFEPFNLNEEREEGYYDTFLNYHNEVYPLFLCKDNRKCLYTVCVEC